MTGINNMKMKKIRTVSVNEFWGALASQAMTYAWGKEDEIWDKFAKRH